MHHRQNPMDAKSCTCTLSADQSRKRKQYGLRELFRFQQKLKSLNLAKDDYWQGSNLRYLDALENCSPQAITAMITLQSSRLDQTTQLGIVEKLQNLIPAYHSGKPINVIPFINGIPDDHKRHLSDPAISLEKLAHVIDDLYPQSLRQLEKTHHEDTHIMRMLNTSLVSLSEALHGERHEVFIRIPQDQNIQQPLYFCFLDNALGQNKISSPRIHLHLSTNASLVLIEKHTASQTLLQNTYLNITLDPGATLTHIQEMSEGTELNHVHMTHSRLAKGSHYRSFVLQQGAQSSVLEKKFALLGEGARTSLHGLSLAKQRQHFNNIITIDHLVPQTFSEQNYKFVLRDYARGGFTGNVIVHRQAQQIQSDQLCKTLLLGEKAVMSIRPQLEIFADDVKCGHGATIGQLNPEEVFYLTSRGLTQQAAIDLLARAFIGQFFTSLNKCLNESLSKSPSQSPNQSLHFAPSDTHPIAQDMLSAASLS